MEKATAPAEAEGDGSPPVAAAAPPPGELGSPGGGGSSPAPRGLVRVCDLLLKKPPPQNPKAKRSPDLPPPQQQRQRPRPRRPGPGRPSSNNSGEEEEEEESKLKLAEEQKLTEGYRDHKQSWDLNSVPVTPKLSESFRSHHVACSVKNCHSKGAHHLEDAM